MSDIAERKKEVRKKLSSLRNELAKDYRNVCDGLIFDLVVNSEAYLKSTTVLAYYPVKSEPQIIPIICRAIDDGKNVAFPISNTNDYTLKFKYVKDISQLQMGAYSIPEPPQSAPEYNGEGTVLCIVPAIAFDKSGRRIGYGKGFYDRFLAKFKGVTMGVCYSRLLVESLPCEDVDIPIDIIITEKGEININAD